MNLGDIESVRGGLTLPLLAGDEPFGLSEAEYFTPDDWAWLFLSMNRDYAKAFEAQAAIGAAGNDALQAFCEDALNADVIPDRDGSCRSRFGLAAWVSPSLERLPRLRNNGSWFFPVMSPIPENHLRTEVSDVPFIPPTRPQHPANPYLQAIESPFGYLPTRTVPRSTHASVEISWQLTWVAVDCSVPPEGQLRAISWLAKHHRKQLQNFGFQTYDNAESPCLIGVSESDVFSHMQFKKAAGVGNQTNPSDCWFAICLDVLGPIVSQIAEYAKLLRQKHQELLDAGLIYSPFATRFMKTLPPVEGKNGGFRLKALHVLSELSSWGYSHHQIDEIIGGHRLSSGHRPAWRENFSENIERYVQEGQALIHGDYRWLVHAQKPVFANG